MATIRKREGKKGVSYSIRSSCGYDSTGRHLERSITWRPAPGMTPRQIEKEVNRQAVLLDEETAVYGIGCGQIKFETFARQWFIKYAEPNLRPRTVARMHQLEPRTYAALGHIRLDRLRARHIQLFIDNLGETGIRERKITARPKDDIAALLAAQGRTQKDLAAASHISCSTISSLCRGNCVSIHTADAVAAALGRTTKELFSIRRDENGQLSPKTIRHYLSFISDVLEYAYRFELIHENPCRRVIAPSAVQSEQDCLSLAEAQAFLESLEDAPLLYRAFFTLAIYSGCRRSEMLGLEWRDIDFTQQILSVRRTAQYLKGRGVYVDGTKTAKSKRTLKLPAPVFSVLDQLHQEQLKMQPLLGDQWQNSGRVFVGPFGAPIHPNTPYHWLSQFCQKTGQRFLGIHAFRHLNASLLIASGADIKTVSASLGHSQVTTTLNIYAHAFAEAQAKASDAVANLLQQDLSDKP